MKQFHFIVNQYEDILVTYNGQFLFRQMWSNILSFEGNIDAAAVAAERIMREMAERGKLAAQAGKKLAKTIL